MATITLTVPNAVVNRIQDAIGTRFGFTGFLPNSTTPETKAEFLKRQIGIWLKSQVREHEANTAAAAAATTAGTSVDTDIIVT